MGITSGAYTGYCERNKIEAKAIKDLTQEDATDFYLDRFFKASILSLPQDLWHIVFDMQVMSGRWGIKILQTALSDHFGATKLVVDGYIGDKTSICAINAVDRYGASKVIDIVTICRLHFYKDLVYTDPSQKIFLDGWNNRACKFFSFNI